MSQTTLEYNETLIALDRLQSLFTCDSCKESKELFSLATCTHSICNQCAKTTANVVCCPICKIPAKVRGLRRNVQLNHLSNKTKNAHELATEKSAIPMEGNREKSFLNVEDARRRVPDIYVKSPVDNPNASDSSKKSKKEKEKKEKSEKRSRSKESSTNTGSEKGEKEERKKSSSDGNENKNKNGEEKQSSRSSNKRKQSPPRKPEQNKRIKSKSDSVPAKLLDVPLFDVPTNDVDKPVEKLVTPAKQPRTNEKNDESVVGSKESEKKSSKHSSSSSKRANVSNSREGDEKRDKMGNNPLQKACMSDVEDVKLVERLLSEGANPNVCDNNRWTPLHEACYRGHYKTVELLLKNGAVVDAPGGDDLLTPLQDAIRRRHADVVELLLINGASVERRDLKGLSPMDWALSTTDDPQRDKIVKLLKDFQSTKKNRRRSFSKYVVHLPLIECKRPTFVCSGLDVKAQENVKQLASVLTNATVANEFDENATHLIVPPSLCGRTVKFFMALALGKWVVTSDWVDECLRRNCLVAEDAYEAAGSKLLPENGTPRIARLNQLMLQPPLFKGAYVYLRDFSDKDQDFKKVLEYAGAKIATREPKSDDDLLDEHNKMMYYADATSNMRDVNFLIVFNQYSSPTTEKPVVAVNTKRIRTVPLRWMLDCLERYKILDYEEVENL